MNFSEYIKSLLPGFLRRTDGTVTDIDRWAESLGVTLDELKQVIFHVRRAWLLDTAVGQELDLHGQDRRIPRLPNESDDAYRQRLKSAYESYALGGTNPGIAEVLKKMGYPDAYMHELYKDGVVTPLHDGQNFYNSLANHQGGIRWAEFKIFMGIQDDKDYAANERQALLAAIKRSKASHSRMAALVLEPNMADYLALSDQQLATINWGAEDGAAGPILIHTGTAPYGIKHDGQGFYQSGNLRDGAPQLSVELDIGADNIPGTRTHAMAYKHDGGGLRYRHAGSQLRQGLWQHDGKLTHSATNRYSSGVAHYGDKVLIHAGLIPYGAGLVRGNGLTYGSNGLIDGLNLVIKRRGQPSEIDVA